MIVILVITLLVITLKFITVLFIILLNLIIILFKTMKNIKMIKFSNTVYYFIGNCILGIA